MSTTSGPVAESRWKIVGEVLVLWMITALVIKVIVVLQRMLGIHEIVLAAIPVLFMYAPVLVCQIRGVDSYRYPLALPSFREWRPWRQALALNAVVIAVVWIPWLVAWHFYQSFLGNSFVGTLPEAPLRLIGYHLFFVAIPEEFFYRGYIQSRLDEAFPPRLRLLGATVGPALVMTSVVFAAGHSIVEIRWWHFAIFLPSLVFGWMRARTDDVMAGAFFHAWCNVAVTTLESLYGLGPPPT